MLTLVYNTLPIKDFDFLLYKVSNTFDPYKLSVSIN